MKEESFNLYDIIVLAICKTIVHGSMIIKFNRIREWGNKCIYKLKWKV